MVKNCETVTNLTLVEPAYEAWNLLEKSLSRGVYTNFEKSNFVIAPVMFICNVINYMLLILLRLLLNSDNSAV